MIPSHFQGAESFGDVPEARREACPRDTEGLGATEEVGWDLEQGHEEAGTGRTTLMDVTSHHGLSPPAPFCRGITPCLLPAALPGCSLCTALERSCPAVPDTSSVHQQEPGAKGLSSLPSSLG